MKLGIVFRKRESLVEACRQVGIGDEELAIDDGFRDGLPLAVDNPKTHYAKGPEGYVDYPEA